MLASMTSGTRTRKCSRSPSGLMNPCRTISSGMSCAVAGAGSSDAQDDGQEQDKRRPAPCGAGRVRSMGFPMGSGSAYPRPRSSFRGRGASSSSLQRELLHPLPGVDFGGVDVALRIDRQVVHPVELPALRPCGRSGRDLAALAQQRPTDLFVPSATQRYFCARSGETSTSQVDPDPRVSRSTKNSPTKPQTPLSPVGFWHTAPTFVLSNTWMRSLVRSATYTSPSFVIRTAWTGLRKCGAVAGS